MRVNAVIVAAGEGNRMGGGAPKIFLPLAGRPLILHTLARFAESQSVRRLILVASKGEIGKLEQLVRSDPAVAGLECLFQAGGARRQDSVGQGLERLDEDCEIVVVHDGARPLVSPRLIDRCVEQASREGAVVVGTPARDTIKVVSADRRVRETPPRDSLWEVQTPQVFRKEIIVRAYREAAREGVEATDDAMLVERLGINVSLLEGETTNLKITVPEDIPLAEAILRARS